MYCYSACMPQGIYFISDTNKARHHVFLFPVPASINTHFARCLRDTHARLGPLEVCKEDTAFIRSLMETKEFTIETASCNIECHSRNVYLNYFWKSCITAT